MVIELRATGCELRAIPPFYLHFLSSTYYFHQMRKLLFLLLSIGIYCTVSACTTFFIHKNGQMVFGRNYDWVSGSGLVCVNQSGLTKTSTKTSDGETIS